MILYLLFDLEREKEQKEAEIGPHFATSTIIISDDYFDMTTVGERFCNFFAHIFMWNLSMNGHRHRHCQWQDFVNKAISGLVFFIFAFSTQFTEMFNINFCQWLDSKCGSLDLEATALPTEPQPLPYNNASLSHKLKLPKASFLNGPSSASFPFISGLVKQI